MENKIINTYPLCGILYEDGQQFVTMPNGDKIPAQIETTIVDTIGERSIATVKLMVDLRNVTVKETKQNGK